MDFRKMINHGFVILDGATGTYLQGKGMENGVCPETWILQHKDLFVELQKGYIEAGCDVLLAPTFTCNSIKLKEYGEENRQEELIKELIALSKRAVREVNIESAKPIQFSGKEHKVFIAGDISMTGELLYPMGSLSFEDLVDIYKEQVKLCVKEGVDLFVVETMMSLQECRAAVLAIKETCDLPIFVTLTYQDDMRTLYGTNPETAVIVLQAMGVDAIGINCSSGPEQMIKAIEQMRAVAKIPIIAKPNAGLPKLVDGKTCFPMEADEFAKAMNSLIKAGATILGGCCGTTPLHLKKLVENVVEYVAKTENIKIITNKKISALTTERNTTKIDLKQSFYLVGERINPTGKKELQSQLKEGKFEIVANMAKEQVSQGAKILDVNMGMNGIDEKERMLQAVDVITNTVDVPLSIDSSHVEVIESTLRIYPGRALINSISCEKEKYERLLPIAKKYGAMFVLLPLSGAGLPKDISEKKQFIHTVLEEAKKHGLTEKDIVVDGLVTTIGANKNAAKEVLETIRYCKEELKLATICGLSNISFGLPERICINSAFLTMAIGAGLTMAIANPSQTLIANAALASTLLFNQEGANIAYIENVVQTTSVANQKESNTMPEHNESQVMESELTTAVVKGNKDKIIDILNTVLEEGKTPKAIIDEDLIPGINRVGELFEQKKYFLPQLIASAETMELAIHKLEPLLEKERNHKKRQTIVIATVKGDIHDIGKNLVVLMLKNYGYRVIDLGKDVEAEVIIQTAKEENAHMIGLSALMTTTMMSMKDVVDLAKKENLSSKIIIGGAVISKSFADEIGADGYAKDAGEAVRLVNKLIKM